MGVLTNLIFYFILPNSQLMVKVIPPPGTTILKNPLKRRVFAFLHPDSSSNEFDHSQNFTYPLLPQQTLTQPIKARSALPPLPFLSPVPSV